MELQKKEYRSAEVFSEEGRVLVGVPVVFGVPALIHDRTGDFWEIIDPHALDECDMSDSTLKTEHETGGVPLARTPNTLHFDVMPDGLHMRAVLADTEKAKEVYQAVQRRDLRGMSFAFKVQRGGSAYDPLTNTRTVTAIKRIYEVSLCANPAYSSTSIECRSQITEARKRQDERRQLIALASEIIITSQEMT